MVAPSSDFPASLQLAVHCLSPPRSFSAELHPLRALPALNLNPICTGPLEVKHASWKFFSRNMETKMCYLILSVCVLSPQRTESSFGDQDSREPFNSSIPFTSFLSHEKSLQNKFSVQFSHSVTSSSLWAHGLQHTRLPCPSPTPRACSNSCSMSQWCHPTLSSSVTHFSYCLQSFPASGSFARSQFFTSGGQSIGVSASASVLPMIIQDWFSLGWTSWISLQSRGLSGVFSNTTVQKHQFFGAQLSL